MRHHLLVPVFVAALVPVLTSHAASAAPVEAASGMVVIPASTHVLHLAAESGGTSLALTALPEPDSAGVWAALAGLAALAASRPEKRKRKRRKDDA
jgi:MYXO-CTERM domain-containing protein